MNKVLSKNIIFPIVAIIAMISGVWLGSSYDDVKQAKEAPAEIQGVILPRAKTIQPFELFDHNQQSFSLNQMKGHWSLLFVGYTQCPDVCPAALSVLKQVHNLMTKQGDNTPEVVFISIDPERDTYPLLSKYVTYFNKDFVGVTGEISQLKKIAQQLSVMFTKAPGSSGVIDDNDYLMDHSSSFMLINPMGQLQSFLTAPHRAATIVDSIISSQKFYREKQL